MIDLREVTSINQIPADDIVIEVGTDTAVVTIHKTGRIEVEPRNE